VRVEEIVWLAILAPGWVRSVGLVRHSAFVVRAVGSNGAGLIYAKGALSQEVVRLVAFSGLLAAVPIGRVFPGRGAVFALFLAAACLTVNTFLAGRLTARLEYEEAPVLDTPKGRRHRFRLFERQRREAYDASELAEREAFDENEDTTRGDA
jgi:hypothetical protein